MTSATSIFPSYPTAAVVSVVFRGDDVLLVSRKHPPDQGMWGFPGGKIEFGESIEDAAVRELLEETGVHGESNGVVTAVDDYARSEDGTVLYHFILLAVLCTWKAGEPIAADDAEEARWFPTAQLGSGELQLSFNVEAVAQRALQALSEKRRP
jgi:ADP-ribose pyrophosphatase YjhB (NUDIX family)